MNDKFYFVIGLLQKHIFSPKFVGFHIFENRSVFATIWGYNIKMGFEEHTTPLQDHFDTSTMEISSGRGGVVIRQRSKRLGSKTSPSSRTLLTLNRFINFNKSCTKIWKLVFCCVPQLLNFEMLPQRGPAFKTISDV